MRKIACDTFGDYRIYICVCFMVLEVIVDLFVLFTHHSVHVCPVHFALLSLQCFLRLPCIYKLHNHWWKCCTLKVLCCTSGRKPVESGHSGCGGPSSRQQQSRCGEYWRQSAQEEAVSPANVMRMDAIKTKENCRQSEFNYKWKANQERANSLLKWNMTITTSVYAGSSVRLHLHGGALS